MKLSNDHTEVFRLYDKDHNHVLSIVRCLDDCHGKTYDIATPEGKVLACMEEGSKYDMPSLWEALPQNGVEKLEGFTEQEETEMQNRLNAEHGGREE